METNTYYTSNKGSYSEFCEEIQDYLPQCNRILLNDKNYNGDISHLYNLEADAKISLYTRKWLINIYYNHCQKTINVDYISV